MSLGEYFVSTVVDSLLNSPAWDRTMLVWTYDEHGGYYDHVPPPPAIAADDIAPVLSATDQPGAYDRYGFRVPAAVMSPFSKPNYVSHTVYDHTSVLKTIERKRNLPTMTYRDANANDLLDCPDLKRTRSFLGSRKAESWRGLELVALQQGSTLSPEEEALGAEELRRVALLDRSIAVVHEHVAARGYELRRHVDALHAARRHLSCEFEVPIMTSGTIYQDDVEAPAGELLRQVRAEGIRVAGAATPTDPAPCRTSPRRLARVRVAVRISLAQPGSSSRKRVVPLLVDTLPERRVVPAAEHQ